MSVRVMGWAMDCIDDWCARVGHRELTATEAHVALVLADYVNDQDYRAWPSVDSLARRTKLSERAVRNSLRTLEAARIIETERRAAAGSDGQIPKWKRPNLYVWTGGLTLPPTEGHQVPVGPEPDSDRGAPGAATEGHEVPPNRYENRQGTTTRTNPPTPRERGAGCERHTRPRRGCAACEAGKPKPKWCGSCDERTRLVETLDGVIRCRRCHPLTQIRTVD